MEETSAQQWDHKGYLYLRSVVRLEPAVVDGAGARRAQAVEPARRAADAAAGAGAAAAEGGGLATIYQRPHRFCNTSFMHRESVN